MAFGDTPARDSTSIDNSSKEDQNIAILGSHTDTNAYNLADGLDGTTAIVFGSAGNFAVLGTYQAPLQIGGIRLWHDSTNSVLRIKYGSDPSSETDGSPVMEG